MPFDWLKDFQQSLVKAPNYAEKTLAAYKLGIKSGGSIRGVQIQTGDNACAQAQALPLGQIYQPDDAPHLPLAGCPNGGTCQCVYRPVMSYQVEQK